MWYRIEFAASARRHLKALTARQRSIVLDAVDRQLSHSPTTETRNRKRLRPNSLAPWELRVASLRIFYDVAADRRQVNILAIAEKIGNTLLVGGNVVTL